MRQSWTDERLDDLNRTLTERFDQVDKRFEQVDNRFERVEADIREMRAEMHMRFDSMQKTMVQAVVALTTAILAGYAALIGLIATQI